MNNHAFVDESGDESLELSKPTISRFYVVCAIVVEDSKIGSARACFDSVQQRYFRGSEMKSASITDDGKRIRIIQDLAGADFKLYLLVANKSRVSSPGLGHPKSFVKYLHRMLYKELIRDHPSARIVSDQIKNKSFMQEMENYLEARNLKTLFTPFDFVDSRAEICVQAADFISGTVRQCFERNEHTPANDPMMELLRYKVQLFLPYPEEYGRHLKKLPLQFAHDHAIEQRAVEEAERFIRTHSASSEHLDVLLVALARKLLVTLDSQGDIWVSTEELMRHLSSLTDQPLGEQAFRGLIGALRDSDLLISTRNGWGYKIATSLADVVSYVERQNANLAPMIKRVNNARVTVLRATENKVDVLSESQFRNLRAAVDAQPHWVEDTMVLPEREVAAATTLNLQTPFSLQRFTTALPEKVDGGFIVNADSVVEEFGGLFGDE